MKIWIAFCLILAGCASVQHEVIPTQALSPPPIPLDGHAKAGCLGLVNDYCDSLYAPGAEGNLIINKRKGKPIYILQGKTKNGLNQVFFELAKSKMRNREFLPKDFHSVLKAHRYFQKLEDLLERKPYSTMNLIDRIDSAELESDVDYLWSLALKDTLITRISNQFPEFPKLSEESIPPEIAHYEKLEKRMLVSEISRSIWRDHPNWKKVSDTFEGLRKTFLTVIGNLPIDSRIKENWKQRIQTVALVLPGSMPEIADQDCTTTTANAYYYSQLNVITVCAGDFNSEDILLTLAHEMSHALDIDRSLHLFFQNSEISKSLGEVNAQLCGVTEQPLSCAGWAQFKAKMNENLGPLSQFRTSLPELNQCLKRERRTRPLDPQAIARFAKSSVQDRIRSLADEEAFLRITQAKLPLRNGKKAFNPSYLNPCHYLQSHWSTESLDGDLSFLTSFTAEYACSQESDQPERLKKAIVFAQDFFTRMAENMIASEGEFSSRRTMVEENFSSSPSERFADLLGSYVVAESIKSTQSLWDRRMSFLASNSWQCTGPSLSSAFPKETSIMRQYLQDSHTDGDERKKELLSSPVRDMLSCDQDFDWKECRFSEEDQ